MKNTYATNQESLLYKTEKNNNTILPRIVRENKNPATRQHTKYDAKYSKENEVTVAGVFFFVVPVMFMLFCMLSVVKYEGYALFIKTILAGGLILRAIATKWVERVSKQQNRNSVRWMAFAFFMPGLALMIIGQKKKIYDPSEWKKHLYNHNRRIPVALKTIAPQPFQMAS